MTHPNDDLARARWLDRAGTSVAVLSVAAFAAVISFQHIRHLALTHGQTPLAAVLLPLSIDGTVAAASLVMLRAARARLDTPWLARFMLALSVLATLGANVTYGLPFGLEGAALSGWPAVAFIGCAEMAIGMVRKTARRVPTGVGTAGRSSNKTGPEVVPPAVPAKFRPPKVREIRDQYNCSQQTAGKIRAGMAVAARAASNGHGGADE